jgi:hypothetical protein
LHAASLGMVFHFVSSSPGNSSGRRCTTPSR